MSGEVSIANGTISGLGVEEDKNGLAKKDGITLVTVRSGATLSLSDPSLTMVIDSRNGSCVYPSRAPR